MIVRDFSFEIIRGDYNYIVWQKEVRYKNGLALSPEIESETSTTVFTGSIAECMAYIEARNKGYIKINKRI